VDRGSKRRQVKPLADSLLDALDYDSSDDSDFEVGDASGSEGTGNGSDEDGAKDSAAGSESDSDAVGSADEEGIDDEEAKELNEDTEEEEKAKEQSFSDETSSKEAGGTSKNRKKGEKSSDTEPNGTGTAEESSAEPKKWNLRRNRPMLDFTTMEELNEMDDYDSEDDNDWRPTQGKKKGKASSGKEKEGSEEEEDGGRSLKMSSRQINAAIMKRGGRRRRGDALLYLQKLNSPAVLKAPKERKPSKKEGGSPGKSSNLPAMLYSCGICKKNQDQHLLLLCDTCKLHYHLGCLDPPLTRMPKKTKNSYWQCSECDQASSDEADIAMETLPDGTKRSRRQIKGPIKFIPQEMSPEPKKLQVRGTRTRGQKRKRTSICEEEKIEEPSLRERRQRQSTLQKKPKADDTRTECTTCKGSGDNENLVRCDECQLCYHFGCLDPPLKKSPKQTGYGWICQECDTSSSKVRVNKNPPLPRTAAL
uniref:PHD finger protein 14 n=1 Tax=Cyprinus carpio TaxID=7962 RepID=A0A8C1ME10_CYPCA